MNNKNNNNIKIHNNSNNNRDRKFWNKNKQIRKLVMRKLRKM